MPSGRPTRLPRRQSAMRARTAIPPSVPTASTLTRGPRSAWYRATDAALDDPDLAVTPTPVAVQPRPIVAGQSGLERQIHQEIDDEQT